MSPPPSPPVSSSATSAAAAAATWEQMGGVLGATLGFVGSARRGVGSWTNRVWSVTQKLTHTQVPYPLHPSPLSISRSPDFPHSGPPLSPLDTTPPLRIHIISSTSPACTTPPLDLPLSDFPHSGPPLSPLDTTSPLRIHIISSTSPTCMSSRGVCRLPPGKRKTSVSAAASV